MSIVKQIVKRAGVAVLAGCLVAGTAFAGHDGDEITVAYFLDWPTANQVAQIDKTYDKEMGVTVNWRAFGNGNEMSQAMASGNVQIAYSQGIVPFIVAVSQGLDLKIVGIATSYLESDNCVVSKASGITKANARQLEGKKIGTPIGNVTHYKLMRMFDHLGVDAAKVDLVQMNPPEVAMAFARGDIVMGCAWAGSLLRMLEVGSPLMTAAEQEAIGIRVFDVISVTGDFVAEHPDLVQTFINVTDRANAAYAADKKAALPKIAKAAGLDLPTAEKLIAMASFPSKAEQASPAWLGGTVQTFIKNVADFLVAQKQMDKTLDSYDAVMTTTFVKE